MGKIRGAALCACAIVAVAGCARTEPPYPVRSLKDTAAAPQPPVVAQPPVVPQPSAVAQPPVVPQPSAVAQPPVVPQPSAVAQPAVVPQPSVVGRAKAEQASQCGQRHVDHRKDTLKESEELKRDRDARCAELHRYDYVE
jgi:hypothetical protein